MPLIRDRHASVSMCREVLSFCRKGRAPDDGWCGCVCRQGLFKFGRSPSGFDSRWGSDSNDQQWFSFWLPFKPPKKRYQASKSHAHIFGTIPLTLGCGRRNLPRLTGPFAPLELLTRRTGSMGHGCVFVSGCHKGLTYLPCGLTHETSE